MPRSADRVQHFSANSAPWIFFRSCAADALHFFSLVIVKTIITDRDSLKLCFEPQEYVLSRLRQFRFELNYTYAQQLNYMDDWALKADASCQGPSVCRATVAPVINSISSQDLFDLPCLACIHLIHLTIPGQAPTRISGRRLVSRIHDEMGNQFLRRRR